MAQYYSDGNLKKIWQFTWENNSDRYDEEENAKKQINVNRERLKRTYNAKKRRLLLTKHRVLDNHYRKWGRSNGTPPCMRTPLSIFVGRTDWQHRIKIKLKRGSELYTSKIFFFFQILKIII